MGKGKLSSEVKTAIKEAVNAGLQAGRLQAERVANDAYKATERRLYALPVLVKKVEDNKQRLEELKQTGAPERSKDVIRFTRPGVRLSASEILEALIHDIEAGIASDEAEIDTVKKAVRNIEGDPYYLAVKGRYFEQISDEEISRTIVCDVRTVRRHRSRLVRIVAIWLYGAEAV